MRGRVALVFAVLLAIGCGDDPPPKPAGAAAKKKPGGKKRGAGRAAKAKKKGALRVYPKIADDDRREFRERDFGVKISYRFFL